MTIRAQPSYPMTPNWRMWPSADLNVSPKTVNGRTYSGTPGVAQSIVFCDAAQLQSNGWTRIAPTGPSSMRPHGQTGPNSVGPGDSFFDETLNLLIVFDGASWRDPVSGSVV